ncbi:zinc transporter 10 [Tachysurus fulvidraco]|uniref:zinc transporter 10 n=1 Tax=Tachysurus fulvidraco TaxID=1234273 RepID=UPI001FF00EAB|nr:zinc transporter 10 [Tachysurus fulvidraco]XP_047678317.1 zinc transporter 10 [Tachysurus fulvidraco]
MDRSAVWAEPLHRCMLVLTCTLLLCEVIAGHLCNSLMNTVDSFHTLYILIDMITSQRGSEENPGVSTQPRTTESGEESCPNLCAEESHTSPLSDGSQYARIRLQPVGGLISALMLSSLCVSFSFHIFSHTLQPQPIQHPLLATAVGACSLLFNLLLLVWRRARRTDAGDKDLRKGGTEAPLTPAGSPQGRVLMFCNPGVPSVLHPDSQDQTFPPHNISVSHDAAGDISECIRNIITVFHSLLGSALILLNGLLHLLSVRFQESWGVTVYLDPGFSMLTTLVLIAVVVPELRRHVFLLLQACPAGLSTEELAVEIGGVPGVLAVHELHVWQLTETCIVASVHVYWPSSLSALECSQLLRSITEVLRRFGVKRCTIQPEFLTFDPEDAALRPDCALHCGKACVRKMCCLPPEERFSSTSVHVTHS